MVLNRFFTILNGIHVRGKYLSQTVRDLSYSIEYRPLKGRGFLFNLIFSVTISGIITAIEIYQSGFNVPFWSMIGRFTINSLLVMLGLTVFGYPIILLLKKVNLAAPWYTYRFRRIMIDFMLILGISIVAAIFFGLIVKNPQSQGYSILSILMRYFTFSFIACMTFVLVIEAFVIFNEGQMLKAKNEKLIRENLESRYEVLKNQINPHFLFNNLNVLSSIVYQDPKLADKFIVEFSNIYRYILEMQNEVVVSFRQELEFLDSYIYLLKQRFHEGIIIKRQMSDINLEHKVPPLTLQLLMENVVKHNVISTDHPLTVYFIENDETFMVKNKIALRNQSKTQSGLGLKNISERYSMLTNRSVTVAETHDYFSVTIPLLKIN